MYRLIESTSSGIAGFNATDKSLYMYMLLETEGGYWREVNF